MIPESAISSVQVVEVPVKSSRPKLFEGAIKNWQFVMKFTLLSIFFLLAQFAYQYFVLASGELNNALIRSFAFAGATFFGFALFSTVLFKWKPEWSKYWYIRRSLGVMGFVFIFFHAAFVIYFSFGGNLSALFWNLNPFQNPIIFGAIAFPIFFLLFITSTDWAVAKIGATKWKMLHRLVYLGYVASILHFTLINPVRLMNFAGYLLLAATALAFGGELFYFYQTVNKVSKKTNRI